MNSLSLDIESFAAKRREGQDVAAARLVDIVKAAFADNSMDELTSEASRIYDEIYRSETGRAPSVTPDEFDDLFSPIRDAMAKANEDSDASLTALAIANSVINAATARAASDEGLFLEWVTMRDPAVRESHSHVEGEIRPLGESWSVGGVDMPYPGWMGAPISEWAGCRCVLRPTESSASLSLVAAPEVSSTTLSIMAIPSGNLPVDDLEPHATLVYFGEFSDEAVIQQIKDWVGQVAEDAEPFSASVTSLEPLGDANAVWMLGESDLNGIHEGLMSNDSVRQVYDAADTTKYPTYTPHVTATYDGEASEDMEEVETITFDRLAVWHGSNRTEYILGAEMDDEQIEDTVPEDSDITAEDAGIVPWHGVLAVEGRDSGDARYFEANSLTHRMMSDRNGLPLTWQERATDGHDDAVTIGGIAGMGRDPEGRIWAWGWVRKTEEADKFTGYVAEFGKVGVSIDADDAVVAMDEETGLRRFAYGRIASACAVNIPALPHAWVALGEIPQETLESLSPLREAEASVREQAEAEGMGIEDYLGFGAKVEAAAEMDAEGIVAAIESRVTAKRGAGWLTHPQETRRIHRYWTEPGQPGFVKIGWGTGGDWARCRALVGEKIAANSPEDMRFLNQICAQWHHDALGIWPGEHKAAAEQTDSDVSLISLSASAVWDDVPAEWFTRPETMPDTGITITEEGRTFGYIAEWGVCHIGFDNVCVEAPQSASEYAFFATGTVDTTDGPVSVGTLTIDTGHAGPRLGARPAAAHYDNTGSSWAYVACGEDDRGIWFSGMVRPGTSQDTLNVVKASGRISGDWREIRGNLELVAGLTVNVAGFPIESPQAVVADGRQVALIAAGIVQEKAEDESEPMAELASAIVDEIEARQSRRSKMAAIRSGIE